VKLKRRLGRQRSRRRVARAEGVEQATGPAVAEAAWAVFCF
jgi:hypothetical protein